jgi:hypothetical protein
MVAVRFTLEVGGRTVGMTKAEIVRRDEPARTVAGS